MNIFWFKTGAVIGLVIGFLHPDNLFWGVGALGFALPWGVVFSLIGLLIDFVVKKINDKPSPKTHVKCPDCRELVLKDARKCKHCGCLLIPQ